MRPGLSGAELLKNIFPDGVPVLWCPPLTHYDENGAIDARRIAAHLQHLAPHVKGFLIPGSTGDGWELTDHESRRLLQLALSHAQNLELHLLIGVLKPEAGEVLKTIRGTVEWLKSHTHEAEAEDALRMARVCGFTVCAPRGKGLAQEAIGHALASILEAGLPTALYQLPQVTQNQIGPDLASSLAARFPNFILFKDSSGGDQVVLSGKNLNSIFAMRGAEGDYTRWLNRAGGPYHGFLLASANCFAAELARIIADINNGRLTEAQQLSQRVTAVVSEVSQLVKSLPHGNPFANANKALDHFFAFGPRAADLPPPRIYGGGQLPAETLQAAGEILSREGLMPVNGYLD